MLLKYLRGVINHIPIINTYTDEIEILTVVLPLVFSLPLLLNKFRLLDYTIFLSFILAYLSNYAIHPDNIEYLNKHAFVCLCTVYPLYFIGRIIDIHKYFDAFVVISSFCILISLFYFLHYAQQAKNINEVAGDDNMYTAYQVLPHVMMLLWAAIRKFNIFYLALAIFGIIFLVSCGTRGPLACLLFFFLCYFLFYMRFRYAYIVKLIIVILGIITVSFLHEIMSFLVLKFTRLNLSTRIIDKFIEGEIGNDSGRGSLQESLRYYLETRGNFFGVGYFGSEKYGYAYAHDIVLDFQISFGYVLGTIMLTALFVLLAKAVLKARTLDESTFLLMLISFTVVKFFLSGTFVYEPFLYILIGYCVTIIMSKKTKTI